MIYRRFLKRPMDIVLSALLLGLLLPLLAIGLALAAFAARGNPLFIHVRPGLNSVPFPLYKLCTMRPPLDATGRMLSNAERITPLGRWLRRSSLDELPQLLNVLRGELSLVGPRPLEMRYLVAYTSEQARRHDVRPGITGLAQVSGRNTLSWEEKFTLDVQYVDNLSFALDARILLRTVSKALSGAGVDQSSEHTVRPFTPAVPASAHAGTHAGVRGNVRGGASGSAARRGEQG